MTTTASTADLTEAIHRVAVAARAFATLAIKRLRSIAVVDGAVDRARLIEHQYAAHGCAWISAYATAIEATDRQLGSGNGEADLAVMATALGVSEYAQQMAHGIAMSQGELVRPADLGLVAAAAELASNADVVRLRDLTSDPAFIPSLAGGLSLRGPDAGLVAGDEDASLRMMRAQCERFVGDRVTGRAQGWHLADALVPDAVVDEMAGLGFFGLTVPEVYGGPGLGAQAAALVAEELCRGYIGVGSIGTRADIAAELIIHGGTEGQRRAFLPGIVSGQTIPTAVFTEPEAGSDMAAIATIARRDGDRYLVTGTKLWITHGARADLMTLLVRTDQDEEGYRGLTMLLAEKPRGTDAVPFPAPGMSGSEIPVLGYRGMKEYEVRFDDFAVPAANVLGGIEGAGFKQLMSTFETARIQTAGRAIGVARAAFAEALSYAGDRRQFGRAIIDYPRIGRKLAAMAGEIAVIRCLIGHAALQRDEAVAGRSDVEAGMAKLLAARVAWSCADNGLQIHGGTGYASEHVAARLLCDARILSIFEGTAEIQADIIARGLAVRDTGGSGGSRA